MARLRRRLRRLGEESSVAVTRRNDGARDLGEYGRRWIEKRLNEIRTNG
jgi:hypothetical protein